ncbi:hypothetical protein [Bosea lathyri]|uniref:hypothetical protein n=1 Tax=Bosea lathyri TaxID=1036778 RepID=UPI0011B0A017|nr:hypothetical protein [Bosea lathyri]
MIAYMSLACGRTGRDMPVWASVSRRGVASAGRPLIAGVWSDESPDRGQLALDVVYRSLILPRLNGVVWAFDEDIILGKRQYSIEFYDFFDKIRRGNWIYDQLSVLVVAVINGFCSNLQGDIHYILSRFVDMDCVDLLLQKLEFGVD